MTEGEAVNEMAIWRFNFSAYLDEEIRNETVHDEGGVADLADCTMRCLETLDTCRDPDVDLDLVEGVLTITLEVTDTDWDQASKNAISTIRTALSHCGAATPGWERMRMDWSPVVGVWEPTSEREPQKL